jgi:SAM-dependent methyltransferase
VVEWGDYYAWGEGRALRPLLARALELAPAPGTAVDLGSGSGRETIELLERGWRVVAVDSEPEAARRLEAKVSAGSRERLEVRTAAFQDIQALPYADLVHSAFSLPFCPPEAFDRLWNLTTGCLRPHGLIAVDLFGDRDSWASENNDLTFHSRDDVDQLLASLDAIEVVEEENDGPAFSGPKHWHVFHVFARRNH